MSSSSSSECCDGCCCNGVDSNINRRGWRQPFFCNTTQPFVYYAHVPPIRRGQRSKEMRNESPNCFVKAFRWYTEEHVSPQYSNFNPNMTGFAAWLDTKYQQFVDESELEQTSYFVKLQQTSSFEARKTTKETKSKTKRKSRLKSPWRRRRSPKKEGGDMSQKSHHSFEYILQPKEMTRNVSEWCQPTPTSLRNRSNVTIVSTQVCNCKKPTAKSLSLTSVHQDNKSNATFVTKEAIDTVKETNYSSNDAGAVKTRELSCQCVLEEASKKSAGTQYENPGTNAIKAEEEKMKNKLPTGQICEPSSSELEVIIKSLDEMPKKGTVRKMVQEFDPRRHTSCQCTEKITTLDACCQCETNAGFNDNNVTQQTNVAAIKSSSRHVKSTLTHTVLGANSFKISIQNCAVQTSDHPINLDNDLIHQYPFFMRIVCADKLCEDSINR